MINVILKGGNVAQFTEGITVAQVAASISEGLARAALVGAVDGEVKDLSYKIDRDCSVEIMTFADEAGKRAYRHTTSHIMAQAVKKLFPDARLAIGPAIENGFYYDFDIVRPFLPDDLVKIEAEMTRIIKEDAPLERFTLSRAEALKLMSDRNEPYKIELINDLPEEEELSFYRQGDFVDLCAGPHLTSTGKVKTFKLLSTAGAYWRGDEKNKMLQRIYGTSFLKKADLDEYLAFIEEAEKRDHRRIGKDLDLFSMSDATGPGLVLWHKKGGRIRTIIEEFWRREHYKNGYDIVYSPHIGRSTLWETSGHLGFFRENMYSPIVIEDQEYFLKPMNCPFHIAMYKSRMWSYRDLPQRWAELGTVYRYEKSGVLHGLMRVRGFTQDDAHIFCSPEQMPEEIRKVLKFCLHMLKYFGFEKYKLYLATRPAKTNAGSDEMWEAATAALQDAIRAEGLDCEIDEGGGAFYGPKIDIKIKDALNREWQCSTIQFDFNMPQRFDMSFIAASGEKKQPYMIHRALFGSIERFFGVLLEHYAGALPLWLSPVQVKLMPISDRQYEYTAELKKKLEELDYRVEADLRNEKIGYKIREAQLEKVPFMLIIGDKEVEAGQVSVRSRNQGDLGSMTFEKFIELMIEAISSKK